MADLLSLLFGGQPTQDQTLPLANTGVPQTQQPQAPQQAPSPIQFAPLPQAPKAEPDLMQLLTALGGLGLNVAGIATRAGAAGDPLLKQSGALGEDAEKRRKGEADQLKAKAGLEADEAEATGMLKQIEKLPVDLQDTALALATHRRVEPLRALLKEQRGLVSKEESQARSQAFQERMTRMRHGLALERLRNTQEGPGALDYLMTGGPNGNSLLSPKDTPETIIAKLAGTKHRVGEDTADAIHEYLQTTGQVETPPSLRSRVAAKVKSFIPGTGEGAKAKPAAKASQGQRMFSPSQNKWFIKKPDGSIVPE
jgi:hypothetical protein